MDFAVIFLQKIRNFQKPNAGWFCTEAKHQPVCRRGGAFCLQSADYHLIEYIQAPCLTLLYLTETKKLTNV